MLLFVLVFLGCFDDCVSFVKSVWINLLCVSVGVEDKESWICKLMSCN